MRKRRVTKVRPHLEPLEEKRSLSVGASAEPLANLNAAANSIAPRSDAPQLGTPAHAIAAARHRLVAARHHRQAPNAAGDGSTISARGPIANHGFAVYRITNPNRFNNKLIPPFGHVLVQSRQPVPGQVYNVLYVVVRNGTAQTFDAASGFSVKFPGSTQKFPILTGSQQWKPGEEEVFYVLTKKYYPVPNVVSSGFEFNLGGIYSAAIPGPSGIFLRLKYNPARFDRMLDWIVAFGPGSEGGSGVKYGLPDTAIYELLSAKTNRPDWGGYF
jgi:hypothetical protein